MSKGTRRAILFLFKIIKNKKKLIIWLLIRFVSALFPLLTIYLFSLIVRALENNKTYDQILLLVALVFVVRIIDNFARIRSIFKLEKIISNIQFELHNYFTQGMKAANKEQRLKSLESIRNFSNAVVVTLQLIRQPGIDSLVSLVFIPSILFFLDFKVFIITVAYILVYYFTDHYTTQHYASLKNTQNLKIENYYAKLEISNKTRKEEKEFSRQFKKLCNWSFVEWFTLQNITTIFYCLILFILIPPIINNQNDIADLVLIIGYINSTQVLLNSFSDINDKLTDTKVALTRLARSPHVASVSLKDLVE